MNELFNDLLINLLVSFLFKIFTSKPRTFLCSHLTDVEEKYYSEYVSLINLYTNRNSFHILPIDVQLHK